MSALLALVPVAISVLFLFVVWRRLAVAPAWGARWPRSVLALVLAALLAATLASFDVWGGQWSAATMRPVAWSGAAFLATCLYLFLGLLVVAVIAGVVGVVRWRHDDHGRTARRRVNRVGAPLVALLSVGVTGYGAWEASRPAITRVELSSPQVPAELDGARIALVSDIHAGAVRSADFTQKVVELVNGQEPDLVLIAGDLVDGYADRYGPEIAPLAGLEAPLGVFAVTGNHEMYRDTANWLRTFEAVGVEVLVNEAVQVERGGATLSVAGTHDLEGVGAFAPDPAGAVADTDPDAFTVLISHQPRAAFEVQGLGVDLQVSGHTHGGQLWPLRYLVPLQQPTVDGLQTVGDVPVLTSRGAGAWGPAVRVLAPPEVPVLTLRRR